MVGIVRAAAVMPMRIAFIIVIVSQCICAGSISRTLSLMIASCQCYFCFIQRFLLLLLTYLLQRRAEEELGTRKQLTATNANEGNILWPSREITYELNDMMYHRTLRSTTQQSCELLQMSDLVNEFVGPMSASREALYWSRSSRYAAAGVEWWWWGHFDSESIALYTCNWLAVQPVHLLSPSLAGVL